MQFAADLTTSSGTDSSDSPDNSSSIWIIVGVCLFVALLGMAAYALHHHSRNKAKDAPETVYAQATSCSEDVGGKTDEVQLEMKVPSAPPVAVYAQACVLSDGDTGQKI